MKKQLHIVIAAGLVLLLPGCRESENAGAGKAALEEAGGAEISATRLLLPEAPAGALSLNEAVAAAQPGDPVVVEGRIGGVRNPITNGLAAFILADESVSFCDENPDEGCPTPWDACCEDPEKLAQSRAFVQFIGAGDLPLQLDLREAGLAANQTVIVKGRLSPDSGPDNRIILAEGVFPVERDAP